MHLSLCYLFSPNLVQIGFIFKIAAIGTIGRKWTFSTECRVYRVSHCRPLVLLFQLPWSCYLSSDSQLKGGSSKFYWVPHCAGN